MDTIKDLWDANRGYDAGIIIVENLPSSVKPRWAARILRLVTSKSGVDHPAIDEVLAIADTQSDWGNAHDAFSRVRDQVLQLDDQRANGLSSDDQLLSWVFSLAESVAKVTYNATVPDDEFDEDSGAWVVASLRGFVEMWKQDTQFATDAYDLVRDKS